MDQHNPVYAFDDQEESLVKDRSNTTRAMSRGREADKNTSRGLQRNTAHEPTTLVINSERKSKRTYFLTIVAAVFLFLLALSLVAVVVYAPLANNLSKESKDLQAEFQKLKLQVNQSQQEIHISINNRNLNTESEIHQLMVYQEGNSSQLTAHTAAYDAFQDTVNEQLSSLQLVVNSVNHVQHLTTTQLSEVQSSIDTLRSMLNISTSQLNSLRTTWDSHSTAMAQLNSLQTVVNGLNTVQHSTTSHLNSLQSSVNTITDRVNSPVNLYQNCTEETRSCTISTSSSSNYYWRYCTTPSLAINSTVSSPSVITIVYNCVIQPCMYKHTYIYSGTSLNGPPLNSGHRLYNGQKLRSGIHSYTCSTYKPPLHVVLRWCTCYIGVPLYTVTILLWLYSWLHVLFHTHRGCTQRHEM